MKLLAFGLLALCCGGFLSAQITIRNAGPVETDSQGHVIEKLDYDRKIVATNGLPSAAEYRAELAERERMRKVAREVGPWFEAIQHLEVVQKDSEAKYDADGGGEAGDGVKEVIGQSGQGMAAYIEAMRVFNSSTAEGGSVARDARQLKAALDELLYRRGGEVVCGPGRGVSMKYPLELLLVRYQSWKAQSTPMKELYAAKSADLWPGKVPADAERVTKKVTLYPGEGGYISTGLYVPPGEVITIKCGSLTGNLTAQIGCHTDKLDPKIVPLDEEGNPMDDPYNPVAPNLSKVKMGWQQITDNRPLWRWPDMVRRFQIKKKKEEIGHVLGGVLWFTWSGGSRPMTIEVSGCVQMPWFRLGIDTNQGWIDRISKYPAPWAELQAKTIIFTVESKYLRNVKNIEALAQWWGKAACIMLRTSGRGLPTDGEADNFRPAKREWGILDKKLVQMNEEAPPDTEELVREAAKTNAGATADRYGIPVAQEPVPVDPKKPKALKIPSRENEPKFTPMRLVDDVQISVGAGHSGYPIMCMEWGGGMMNLKGLQISGSWGALHEIGHNMGQGANGIFALPGNSEVICNFFGTCTMNLLNGTSFKRIKKEAWDGVAKNVADRKPDLWMKSQVFERLVFYMTLAHYFGVESVVKVVNDNSEFPANAIGDRLCCAWSKAVGRDLTPYFDIWGLPLSKAAYTYTQDWPPWPTDDDKALLFSQPMEYRGQVEEIELDTRNPEDIPTRRQLRAREHFKKTVKE